MLLACLSSPVVAQSVRGTVVEELSQRPVIGGLVQLLDSSRVGASAVTDDQGRFLLAVVPRGRYRVRVLRIGFRPWGSDSLFTVADGERQVVLTVPVVPVLLDDIAVEGSSACRATPEADRRVALLWDQARTSLGLLGGGRRDLDYHVTISRRRLDAAGRVHNYEVLPGVGQGAWPVTSQPAESLALLGFVQPQDTLDGPVYFGPDVAVFFSDAFLKTHCFRLVAPGATERWLLGVGFAPVRGRAVPDIEGTLWLDRRSGHLHRLEYQYGAPIITGWKLKAPVARRLPWRRTGDATGRRFFGEAEVMLGGYREEEAVVTEVRSTDGTVVWKRTATEAPPVVRPTPSRR
jgi:Carboxypeptidase regulatory-like domain